MAGSNHSNGTNKSVVERYWRGRADEYDGDGISGIHRADQRDAWLDRLRAWTSEHSREALDVGCGTGVIALLLSELGHDVTGIDLAGEMIKQAQSKAEDRNHSVAFCTGDAETLPFPDDCFDVLTARWLLWTLPNPRTAIAEWQRVIRPGGRIVLVEGHWDFSDPWEEYEGIYDELPLFEGRPPEELASFISQSGLEPIKLETLMDPVLWGQQPEFELYAVVVQIPDSTGNGKMDR